MKNKLLKIQLKAVGDAGHVYSSYKTISMLFVKMFQDFRTESYELMHPGRIRNILIISDDKSSC